MRVQHNIMAMGAYRNYTNNVNAMKKNLERLSSGYKINRAGDDAAGLAISEKMRAQITGLETAQKNAKDGISLVQTAEGALQEVHDMLNRMVELATQSANGTYDNTTDRDQLQKEMNQLRAEINRIADGANFNGIKLLDGSMDANGFVNGTGSTSDLINWAAAGTAGASLLLPTVSTNAAGWNNTVLHAGATTGSGTEFAVDLHEFKFNAREGDEITIQIGDVNAGAGTENGVTIKLKATKALGTMTGDQIIAAIKNGTSTTNGYEITINGSDYTGGKVTIKGTEFTLGSSAGGRLTFKQDAVPTSTSTEVLGNMSVSVTATTAGTGITYATGVTALPSSATASKATTPGSTAVYSYDLAAVLADVGKGTYTVSIAGQTVEIDLTDKDDHTATEVAAAIASAINDAQLKWADGGGTASNPTNYVVTASQGVIKFTATTANSASSTGQAGVSDKPATAITGVISIAYKDAADRTTGKIVSGDYNKQTTDVKNVASGGVARIASTSITLTADMFKNDCSFYIGNKYYTITTDEKKKNDADTVYIGDILNSAKTQVAANKLDEACRRLSDAASGNQVWTVGVGDTAGQITLVEKTNTQGAGVGSDLAKTANGLDLTTIEGIAKSLGYKGADVDPTSGKSLTLQIGDTADTFNQLKVNIKDCHTDAMIDSESGKSLADIKISDQESAADAVDVIKSAINYISDVRGTLGATQNRLDHTINNLSVMTENIQDAESTIRDTDIAEEMMAYTKNNILIQASQAMLAQANQVPQGVLQLLQ